MKKSSSGSAFEKLEAEVVKEAGSHMRDNLKKKVQYFGEMSVLVLVGFILVAYGLAKLVGTMYPFLDNGLNFISLGVLLLIIAIVMRL